MLTSLSTNFSSLKSASDNISFNYKIVVYSTNVILIEPPFCNISENRRQHMIDYVSNVSVAVQI